MQDANVERLDPCPVRRQPCDEVQDRSDALARQARGVPQGVQTRLVGVDDARVRFTTRLGRRCVCAMRKSKDMLILLSRVKTWQEKSTLLWEPDPGPIP